MSLLDIYRAPSLVEVPVCPQTFAPLQTQFYDFPWLAVVFLVVLGTSTPIACNRTSVEQVSVDETYSGIVVDPLELNLEPILESQQRLECSFKLFNPTDRHITITEVSKSCGCLSVALGKTELAPRDTTELRLTGDIAGRIGKQRFSVRVGQDTGQELHFSAHVTVHRSVEFEAPDVQFGTVDNAATPSISTHLYVTTPTKDEPSSNIVTLSTPRDLIESKLVLKETRQLGSQLTQRVYDLRLTLLPNAISMPGRQVCTVQAICRHNGEEFTAAFTQLSWQAKEHLRLLPARLMLGAIDNAKPLVRREITIECIRATDPPFEINEVTSSNAAISVHKIEKTSRAGSRRWRVCLRIDGSKIDGFFAESIIIRTNHRSAPELRLPVIAYRAN